MGPFLPMEPHGVRFSITNAEASQQVDWSTVPRSDTGSPLPQGKNFAVRVNNG